MSFGSNSTKIYDADQVAMVFMGVPISSGLNDGVFLEIEQMAEDFTVKVGTDGEVTRSKTNNAVIKIKLHLMQSSGGNVFLSAINLLDKLGSNGAGVGPMLVSDLQGTTAIAAASCWISKPPDMTFDREATERVWELTAVTSARLDGGN
jgi:hypothetical protein